MQKAPEHKRFLYRRPGCADVRVSIITPRELLAEIVGTDAWRYDTPEDAFRATFRRGWLFMRWLDTEWRTD